MKVEAIPLTDFVHDNIRAVEGKVIFPLIEQRLAEELARAGLVRIRMRPQANVQRAREFDDVGKAPAAGTDAPSSSSPAAQASAPTTARTFKRGEPPSPSRAKSSR